MCRKYRTAVMSILTKLKSVARLRLWSRFLCTRSSASLVSWSSSRRIRRSSRAFQTVRGSPRWRSVYCVVGLASHRPVLVLQHPLRARVRDGVQPDLGAGQLAAVHRTGLRQSRSQFGERRTTRSSTCSCCRCSRSSTVAGAASATRGCIFVSSLFTSCAFAFAFYFATVERQRRHKLVRRRGSRLRRVSRLHV